MSRLYMIVGCDSKKFQKLDIVKLITIINDAYLVEHVETNEREWIMKYNLYPLNNHSLSGFHVYNKMYHDLIPEKYRN